MRARFGFRREFAAVVGTVLLGFCVCGSPAQAASSDKPNVVFLLADQWRAKATGYAGDPNVKTPNLDRLARQSLNFRNVVSVCPVCTPYRAALMTGRFPTSTGMFLNDVYLPDRECASPRSSGTPAMRRRTSASGTWTGTAAASSSLPSGGRAGITGKPPSATTITSGPTTTRRLAGEAILGRLRRICPDSGCPGVPAAASPGGSAFCLDGLLRHSAFSAPNGAAGIQGPVSAGQDPTAAERAAGTAGQSPARSSRLLRPLHGAGQVRRRRVGDARRDGPGATDGPRVHLRSRRNAGLARRTAVHEAIAVGRGRTGAVPVALSGCPRSRRGARCRRR